MADETKPPTLVKMTTQELVDRLYAMEKKQEKYEDKVTVQCAIETIRVALEHMEDLRRRIRVKDQQVVALMERAKTFTRS